MRVALRTPEVGVAWLRAGRRVVCALLVEVEGSAPLSSGATMLIAEGGDVEGSITGGCVEAAVVREAESVFAGGGPRKVSYGVSDELAGSVGLTCGGTVRVLVHELTEEAAEIELRGIEASVEGRAVAIATAIDGPGAGSRLALIEGEPHGGLGGPGLLDHAVARDAAGLLTAGKTDVRHYGVEGATLGADIGVHIRSFAPPPQLLIFGAIDFSAAIARLAGEVGYRVTICDAREPFLRSSRFTESAEVVVAWPDFAFSGRELGPRDAVLVFTHDPKFDLPAIRGALATEAGYIGALGSRKTAADRNRRLLEDGVDPEDLQRVFAPCGLDIGGVTPEEVAISVLAELIAARSGRGGGTLRDGSAPIHSAVSRRYRSSGRRRSSA